MTCLCLTRNRRRWLPLAIRCFQQQTYPHRRMLIVADGEDVADLLPADERLHLVHIEPGYSVGEKRNFGCSRATSEIIAHWDDDDWSAPTRLSDQIERLRQRACAVTGYHSMSFSNGREWWRYAGFSNCGLGTSLCYRREWWTAHPFLARNVGEDSDFAATAAQHGQLVSVDAGQLMAASVHRGNTSPRQLSGQQWSTVSETGAWHAEVAALFRASTD